MKTVLIVDDNRIIVQTLKKIVDWEAFGFGEPRTAYNGEDALACSDGVDVLFTDIQMPRMDGLALMRAMRERNTRARFVVLSAYDDFAYVREAFKLGVSEYLLKTEIGKAVVESLLQGFADEARRLEELEQTRRGLLAQRGGAEEIVLKNTGSNRQHIKAIYLARLIHGIGMTPVSQLRGDCPFLRLREGRYAVMDLRLSYEKKLLDEVWKGSIQLFIYAVVNIMEEVCETLGVGDVASADAEEFYIVLSFDSAAPDAQCRSVMHAVFEQIAGHLARCLNTHITAGAALAVHGESFAELYQKSSAACRRQMISGHGRIRFDTDVRNQDASGAVRLDAAALVRHLKNALHTYQPAAIRDCAKEILIPPETVGAEHFSQVMNLYQKYFFVLCDFIEENAMADAFDAAVLAVPNYEDLSMQQINERFCALLEGAAQAVQACSALVRRARHYVSEQYFSDINLTTLAQELDVSSKYLGRLFVEQTGISFNTYLNEVRVSRAKELIRSDSMKLYQVAELVGYASFEHFSRVFKKITGLSPKAFAEKTAL